MPILRINATSRGLALHRNPAPLASGLAAALPGQGPIILMLHGYKYAPSQPEHSPHKKIFGDGPTAWPAQLGFGAQTRDEGLAVAFGWYARGPLHSVYRRATQLGVTLADLITQIKCAAPQRPVHIIAHSLGAQAALSALPHLPARSIQRMVLLTGASFESHARRMLSTAAGRTAEVFNVTSRENDLFDLAFERLVPAPQQGDRAIGQGISAPNVRTWQLDCAATLAALRQHGYAVDDAQRRICHWSSYRRPGVMQLYETLLRTPERVPLSSFDAVLPRCPEARWSRFNPDLSRLALRDLRGVRLPSSLPLGLPLALPLALRAGKRMMRKASLQGKSHEHAY